MTLSNPHNRIAVKCTCKDYPGTPEYAVPQFADCVTLHRRLVTPGTHIQSLIKHVFTLEETWRYEMLTQHNTCLQTLGPGNCITLSWELTWSSNKQPNVLQAISGMPEKQRATRPESEHQQHNMFPTSTVRHTKGLLQQIGTISNCSRLSTSSIQSAKC